MNNEHQKAIHAAIATLSLYGFTFAVEGEHLHAEIPPDLLSDVAAYIALLNGGGDQSRLSHRKAFRLNPASLTVAKADGTVDD